MKVTTTPQKQANSPTVKTVHISDTNLSFHFIQNPMDEGLLNSIMTSNKQAYDLFDSISSAQSNLHETMTRDLKFAEEEKSFYEKMVEEFMQFKNYQNDVISSANNAIKQAETLIAQKSADIIALDLSLKPLEDKFNTLKSEIKYLLETELLSLTKEMTEARINEINKVIETESKDETLIGAMNTFVCLLRKVGEVDVATISVK